MYRTQQQWIGLANQPPDLANSLARIAQVRAMQQQNEAASREMLAANRLQSLLQRPGFVSRVAANDPDALAELGAIGPAGLSIALPRIDAQAQAPQRQEMLRRIMGGSGGGGAALPGGYATRVAQLESPDGRPNPVSGATGPWQIMPALRASFPAGTPDSVIMEETTRRHRDALREGLQRDPTESELFMAHRLGPGGALALLRSDPNTPLDQAMRPVFDGSGPMRPAWAAVVAQNPYLRDARTTGDVVQRLASEWNRGGSAPARADNPPTLTPGVVMGLIGSGDPVLMEIGKALMALVRMDQTPQYRELTPEERRRFGIPDNVPARLNIRENKPELMGQPLTPPGEQPLARLGAEQWAKIQEAGQDATRRLRTIDALDALAPDAWTGAAAESRIAIGRALRLLGIQTEGLSQSEMLRALQRQLELAVTPRGQGQITESERILIRQQIDAMGSSPEAARMLLGFARRMAEYDREAARIVRDVVRRNGGAVDPVAINDALDTLGPRPSIEDAIVAPRQQPTPSIDGPGERGAAGSPPRVRTLEEAARLPRGTIFIDPEGERRRVP